MRIVDKLTAHAKNVLSLMIGLLLSAFIGASFDSMVIFAIVAAGNLILYFGFNESSVLATVCGLITSAQVPDCDNVNTNGVDPVIYLANKSEIASATFTGSTLVMEAITMVSGKKFYSYEAKGFVANHKEETVVGKVQTSFKHNVTTLVFKVSGAAKEELEALCNGDIVAITANRYQGNAGDSEYEVHGWFQGLKGKLTRDQADAENVGAFLLELSTPEGRTEPHLPYAFYKTSRAATQALIAALIA